MADPTPDLPTDALGEPAAAAAERATPPAAPQAVDPEPEPLALPSSPSPTAPLPPLPVAGESRATQLYRAALGPLHTEHYLAVFARFDAAGRRHAVWHPAAALATFSWLVFRRLWGEALVYAAGLGTLVALAVWQWSTLRAWPMGVQMGAAVALLLVLVGGPGLSAHARLHRQVQRRLLRAVSAATTMAQAREALARQAPTRARLWGLVALNGLLLAGLLLGPLRGQLAREATPAVPLAAAPPAPSSPAAPPPPSPLAPPAPLAAPEVEAADLPPTTTTATTTATATATATVTRPASPPPVAAEPAARAAVQTVTAPAAARAAYGINVGLFADPANGRRAFERLRQADLPATLEQMDTPRGPRSRVRVGPYRSRADAEAAAQRVRALGLEAVVF